MTKIIKFLKKNWFLVGILVSLVIGIQFPKPGLFINTGGTASYILMILLFLISGMKIPTESISSGLRDFKVHIYLQVFVFIVVPVYFHFTAFPFADILDGNLLIGILALAALPTTVSSCIVFTQNTGGNTVSAVFNASVANIAGVLISPFILSLLMKTSGFSIPLSELLVILKSLALKILIPLIAGQLLRKWFKPLISKYKSALNILSNAFMLFILLFAFSKASSNSYLRSNLGSLVLPFIYLAVSFLILTALGMLGAKLFKFSREDSITTLFVAPQKTLVLGIPLLSSFFGSNQDLLAIALLPLIFYHPWQLLLAGIFSGFIKRKEAEA